MIANILRRGNGKLISYEANKDVYRLAKASLILNNLESKVELKDLAISDKAGEVEFSYDGFDSLDSVIPANLGEAHITIPEDLKQKRWKRRIVKCTFLDEDLADIPAIDVLRMDIEGSECLAIKGAKKLIERSPNLKIIMEWSPETLRHYCNIDEFLKEIRAYGFEVYLIDDRYLDTGKMQKLSNDQLKKIEFTDILLKRD